MASKREVVVATENYLRSKGYNNSTGKYDRVIMGVKSLLGETLLAYGSPEFERAIQQETERMLKKYVKDSAMEYDPVMCMMVPKKANDKDSFSDYWDFIYNNTHMSMQEAREYAVECWNKGISKYEAIKKKTKDSAMEYDPILRMNVPAITTDAEVAWQEFDRNDRVVTKRKEFKSIEAAEKFIEKVSEKNNFYRILATSDEKTWDHAIQAADAKAEDANTIIESAKAYVKDAERLYNAAKKAKEDFFSTRDEYANRIRTYWVRNKQNMSSEEEEACKSAISKLNGMSYF